MISVMKLYGSFDSWEAVRFPVEMEKNDQGAGLRIIYPTYSSGRLTGLDSKMRID